MCDYSLELYRSRPAAQDEQVTLHRFSSGTMGLVAGTDCETAVCLPTGARLHLEGISDTVQRAFSVGATEDVTMTRLDITGHAHRDAVRFGADGIIVSNHGGRAADTLRATIDCLPEVVAAVNGRIPVFVDGGFRHGTDVYKALASGARAVGIGRPYIWGLSAFGQEGVEKVLDIFRAELTLVMRQMGTPTVKDITAARIARV